MKLEFYAQWAAVIILGGALIAASQTINLQRQAIDMHAVAINSLAARVSTLEAITSAGPGRVAMAKKDARHHD